MGKRKGKSKQSPKPSPAPASSPPPPPSLAGKPKQGARPPAAPAFSAPPPPSLAGTPKQGARPSAASASSAPPPSLAELSALVEKLTKDHDPSAPRVRLFNRSRPPVDPPPKAVFPNYPSAGSSTATPLPPPGMPKHRFLRRFLPLILTANLAIGGYVLLSNPKKELSEKDVDAATEVPSLQVESIEATNA